MCPNAASELQNMEHVGQNMASLRSHHSRLQLLMFMMRIDGNQRTRRYHRILIGTDELPRVGFLRTKVPGHTGHNDGHFIS